MEKYVALLRGINVGGHKKVPMSDLKRSFEKMGAKNIRTVLASGNVVFQGDENIVKNIEEQLNADFGFFIPTIVISHKTLVKIASTKIFKAFNDNKRIHLYITFLKEKPGASLRTEYESEDSSFNILSVTDNVVYSILNLDKRGTVDAMKIMENKFGKSITTRNLNTVKKLVLL